MGIIYKVNVPDGAAEFPAVVLEEEGDVGKYNRANRALHHFSENGLAVALNIFAGGAVFGLPVMCLTAVYVIARIWYQIAYAVGGYGMGCRSRYTVPSFLRSSRCLSGLRVSTCLRFEVDATMPALCGHVCGARFKSTFPMLSFHGTTDLET